MDDKVREFAPTVLIKAVVIARPRTTAERMLNLFLNIECHSFQWMPLAAYIKRTGLSSVRFLNY